MKYAPSALVIAMLLCLHSLASADDLGSDVVAARVTELPIAFTQATFGEVHPADASAAIKAWAECLAREQKTQLDPEPFLVSGLQELRSLFVDGALDVAIATVPEFFALDVDPASVTLFSSTRDGDATERYLILTHKDSGRSDLASLRGATLQAFENPRAAMGLHWVDVQLLDAGLPSPREHFGKIIETRKLSGTVLPVFFRQVDACVVTEYGFQTLVELNPQIGQQLQVVARSEPFVPTLGFFHPAFDASRRRDAVDAILSVPNSEAGLQILRLFQVDAFGEVSASSLDSARALLARSRLYQEAHSTAKPLETLVGAEP